MESLTPEQQLQKLDQEYQQKRAAIEHGVENKEQLPSEHETMSRVLEGAIQQQVPQFQASSHTPHTLIDEMLPPEATAKIQEWINTSFSKGIWQGITDARASGDMALIDAFHNILSGQLYHSLVERKKIPAID